MNSDQSKKIFLPHAVVLGATGRNSGKTELACTLIKKFSHLDPIAIKITTVKEANGCCPRGGQGCGVCSSLKSNWLITEELDSEKDKDTCKMLRAGAKKVLWMRVLEDFLGPALKDLLEKTGTKKPLVIESNRIMQVLEPGLFLICTQNSKELQYIKQSCQKVFHLQDALFTFDLHTKTFPQTEKICHDPSGWFLDELGASVLCGGLSSRMGEDKSLIVLKENPLYLDLCDTLSPFFEKKFLSLRKEQSHKTPGFKRIFDEVKNTGPMQGIFCVLKYCACKAIFFTSCDLPMIKTEWILAMKSLFDGKNPVICRYKDQIHPLLAIYPRSLIPFLKLSLEKNQGSILRTVLSLEKNQPHDFKILWYDLDCDLFNLNSKKDIEAYKKSCNFEGKQP